MVICSLHAARMSKDVLSSTIQMLNQITNGNCCGTPELPAGEDNEATSQKHSNQPDQSLQSHDADTTNENRFLMHAVCVV